MVRVWTRAQEVVDEVRSGTSPVGPERSRVRGDPQRRLWLKVRVDQKGFCTSEVSKVVLRESYTQNSTVGSGSPRSHIHPGPRRLDLRLPRTFRRLASVLGRETPGPSARRASPGLCSRLRERRTKSPASPSDWYRRCGGVTTCGPSFGENVADLVFPSVKGLFLPFVLTHSIRANKNTSVTRLVLLTKASTHHKQTTFLETPFSVVPRSRGGEGNEKTHKGIVRWSNPRRGKKTDHFFILLHFRPMDEGDPPASTDDHSKFTKLLTTI